MRFSLVRTVFLKELREALRDRRTLFMMVALPILLYPMLMFLMTRLQESQEATQKARVSEIAVWGSLPAEVEQRLTAKGRVKLHPWAEAPADIRAQLDSGRLGPPARPAQEVEAEDEDVKPAKDPDTPVFAPARAAILARKVDAVLIAWPGFSSQVKAGGLGVVSVMYDSVRPESRKARDRITDELKQYRDRLLLGRERERKLEPGFTIAIETQTNNVAPPSRKSGMFLGMMLPYMLIFFSAMSGFYAAIDMTAGEKERGTMQTLLCAPLQPLEIVTGKFAAIWSISLMATAVNLISLAATFSRLKLPGLSMNISPLTYLTAFPLVLPITLMITAVFLAVGAFARDFKEGQNFLTPVLMVLIFPLMATMMPGIELNGFLSFVPIVNVALLMKSVFLGEWRADTAFLVITSSLAYAMLALMFAATVFERTNLLLGGKESLGGILEFKRRPGLIPGPAVSFLVFSLVLVLLFYGSLALEGRPPSVLLTVTELGFILLPAVAFARAKGYSFRDTFAWRTPHWRGLAGATLIGCSGWAFAAGVVIRLLPPPESLVKALEKVLMLDNQSVPLWQILLLAAVLPAICEEMLFRGLILSGFRRLGVWPAIALTALLFGVAHASIYRLAPVAFLGIVFGYTVWKTGSIATGMIAHALNNGLMMLMARNRDFLQVLGVPSGSPWLPWPIVIGGTVVLLVGLWLIRSIPDNREEAEPPAALAVSA